MKSIKLLVILLFVTSISYSQNNNEVVIAKKIKLNSVILGGEEQNIFVSLPNNYDASDKSYPVLYLLLGSEVNITYAAGLIKSLSEYEIIPEMIIVAIESNDRKRDCTPTKPKDLPDFKDLKNSGHADTFLSFIETELFSYIDNNYRVPPYRILAGHSDSGLCVSYAFVSHNNMFDSYIAISPSIGWDSNFVNRVAEKIIATMNLKRKQIFLSVAEKEDPLAIKEVHTFARTLKYKASKELKWKLDYFENEDHFSQASNALYKGLRFVYEGYKFDFDEFVARGLVTIKSFFHNLTEKYGYEILPNGNILNAIGMEVLRSGRQEEALNIFAFNIQIHPKIPEVYSCLGSGYLMAGNKELAIENFEKTVELATALKDGNLERYKTQLENAKADKK